MEIGSPENSNSSTAANEMTERITAAKHKMIKTVPHETATQLGSRLSTLFFLLVKMSVGGSTRARQSGFSRSNMIQIPSTSSRNIAGALGNLFALDSRRNIARLRMLYNALESGIFFI